MPITRSRRSWSYCSSRGGRNGIEPTRPKTLPCHLLFVTSLTGYRVVYSMRAAYGHSGRTKTQGGRLLSIGTSGRPAWIGNSLRLLPPLQVLVESCRRSDHPHLSSLTAHRP